MRRRACRRSPSSHPRVACHIFFFFSQAAGCIRCTRGGTHRATSSLRGVFSALVLTCLVQCRAACCLRIHRC